MSISYQVLRILLDDPGKEIYLEEITKRIEIPKMTLFRTLRRMELEAIISSRFDGYRRYWKINDDPTIRALKVLFNVDNEMIRELVKRFKGSALILYGSRAKGTNTPQSDWDLLLIGDDFDRIDLNDFINEIETKYEMTIDLKAYIKDEFDRIKRENTPFYQEVRSSMYLLEGDIDGLQ
jgi:predicted nucleotidyltransferase